MVRSRAVMIAIGINGDGRRCVLAVELANRESASSWQELPAAAEGARAPMGVEFVVSDDHEGLRQSDPEVSARRRSGSVATCTSCATRSTTCRARPTTTA